MNEIGAERFVDQWSARLKCLLGIDYGVEWIIIHFNQVERILSLVRIGCYNCGYRLADIADLAFREHRMKGLWSAIAAHGSVPILSLRSAPVRTATTPGALRVASTSINRCRRERAGCAGPMRAAFPAVQVIDVSSRPGDKAWIFASLDPLADEFGTTAMLGFSPARRLENAQAPARWSFYSRIFLAAYWIALTICCIRCSGRDYLLSRDGSPLGRIAVAVQEIRRRHHHAGVQ